VRVSQSAARPFGEYSTGLLRVNGDEKVAGQTFLAGLFAQVLPKGKVLLYGRLRLGSGRKTILLQRQIKGGRWVRLGRVVVDGRASFERTFTHKPGAQYRLTYPTPAGPRRSGLALKPVPVGG
jgi:hypothetical protein